MDRLELSLHLDENNHLLEQVEAQEPSEEIMKIEGMERRAGGPRRAVKS